MNRREVLVSGGVLGAVAGGRAQAADRPQIGEDLVRYAAFGSKLSGGPGDEASGAWMEERLKTSGFATHRQPFDVPHFEASAATLRAGELSVPLLPQAPWRLTGPAGVEGPLRPWAEGSDVRGAVAVITLPYRRWSAFKAREIEPPVRAALAAGAAAVLIVTTGPTGEGLALNVSLATSAFSAPVAVLAPEAAARLSGSLRAGASVRVTIDGATGVRKAFNLVGRLDRGAGRWLVISTPRSGWFTCAGERGSGVAVWLDLAAWAARTQRGVNVLMTSASGHERDYAGAQLFLKSGEAPAPDRTALWLHLGANVAARDWHELGARLAPLPGADSQRLLVVERGTLPAARRAFQGQPGLEAPYASDEINDGELGEILAAGYVHSAGVFGAHRFHHAPGDDMRCVEPALVVAAASAFRTFAGETLAAVSRR